ncbi:MAG: serine hydrolase domain-containing protein [Actinomycetota bacterium]
MDSDDARRWLDDRAISGEFSGVALVWRDGAPVFEHAAGLAHRGLGVPLTTNSRFQVASVTKMLTAATALRLVDAGRIALDTPLVDLLPDDRRPSALTPEHTLHHLLSHRSGLANYHDDDDETWASFESCWQRVPLGRITGVADLLPLFVDLPLRFPPDERWQYADVNFLVVGLVIEAVTGRPFAEVATDEVLGPAGLVDTAFDRFDHDPERLAVGYAAGDAPGERGRTNVYAVPPVGMPDGGVVTSAKDLARFFDALLGGSLLTQATLELMLEPHGTIPDTDGLEAYGYGAELTLVDGRVTIVGHAGGDPGVSAMTSHFIDESTSVIVLCNQDRGSWPASLHLARACGLPDPRS